MADEKDVFPHERTGNSTEITSGPPPDVVRPEGWKYKRLKIGPLAFPWYASPKTQVGMVAFVCFMCPGMFNALSGLGGGGKTSTHTADSMNTALYSTFAVFGFFGGTFVNKLGVKATLAFGGLGYCIYAIALLVSVHASVSGFNIFAGAFLGVCAGLLWTAQGTIILSYPPEEKKGRYFAAFWMIFNLGGVIGSLIPLGQDIHTKTNSTVKDGVYIAFIILMFSGAVLALLLCNATDVVREDGSRVVVMKNPSWQSEIMGLWETIRYEPFILLLFPMFWSSNWFYTYQQNGINAARFNTRTKALNDCLYWSAQIVGAAIFGSALDYGNIRRSVKAKTCLVVLLVLTMAIYGGGYAYEKQYTRESVAPGSGYIPTDWTDSDYIGPMFLYIFYGGFDACWQTSVYWFMGALSNSGRRTANYVGFYKGLQSAGAAVMWSLDDHNLPYLNEFASNWALLSASILFAAPVIFWKIKDHVPVEEDLKGTDGTLADVLPDVYPEKATV
ncbi:DUF895 domain membrane protein [Xylogone sp. PMI_703]|nr:DUF895 domain membrane protein [Xylogone sp. PMI_703]